MSWLDQLARHAAGPDVSRREVLGTGAARAASDTAPLLDRAATALARPIGRRRMIGVTAGAIGVTALGGVRPRGATADHCGPGFIHCPDPIDDYCCEEGQTCCDGICCGCPTGREFCTTNPPGQPFCCDTGQFCADPENSTCCPAGTTLCGAPGTDPQDCCRPDQDCINGQCFPGCPQGQFRCANTCCNQGQECLFGSSTCRDPCPGGQPRCGDVCCPEGHSCVDGTCRRCAAGQQECGSTCCPSGQFCCDPARGLCCPTGGTCCFAAGGPVCCGPGDECVKQILPGQAAVTPDSPNVCCPPPRTVTATATHLCCPPGRVPQPGGGVSASSGLCCAESDVCGGTCCESRPGFTRTCCNGTCCGYAENGVVCLNGSCVSVTHAQTRSTVTAERDGDVPVVIDPPGGVTAATASVVTVGSRPGLLVRLAQRSVTLGTGRFVLRGTARRPVKVRLSRAGRTTVRRRRQLQVQVVVRSRVRGRTVIVRSRPFTLKAPRGGFL